jgi:P4 family phage/plasmid primase-like protien
LINYLDYTPEEREAFDEHAARLEFDGNMTREEAEQEAARIVRESRNNERAASLTIQERRVAARIAARIAAQDPEHLQVYRELEEAALNRMKSDPLFAYPPNQDGQADAVEAYLDGRAKFVRGLGWAVYSGSSGSFRTDIGESAVRRIVRLVARERWDFRNAEKGEKELLEYARRAVTEPGIRQVMKLLEDALFEKAENYDDNPWLLNCRGETWDLRTGTRDFSAPEMRHMKSAMCAPQEGPAPRFDKFLSEISCGDASLAAWIRRWFGYSLSGDVSTPWFANFYGNGRNGKGTLLHVMGQIMGDYARTIPEEIVVDDGKYANIRHAHAALLGVRCGIADDVKDGKLNLPSIKSITGKDPISAELKYQNQFTFRPIVKITLATNHQLRLTETGASIKDRFRHVPFRFSVLGRSDPGLEDALLREAPQILHRLIMEAVEYFKSPGAAGFPRCEAIERATAEYIKSEDAIGQFLEERAVSAEGESVKAADLYAEFRKWSDARGERRIQSGTWFGRQMAGRAEKIRTMHGLEYCGLKIREIYD